MAKIPQGPESEADLYPSPADRINTLQNVSVQAETTGYKESLLSDPSAKTNGERAVLDWYSFVYLA